MQIFNKQTLYVLSSFIAGFSVMTIELISGRIVAPIIGSSVFTWTSVIGTTLLGLALGSFLGGKIADKTEGNKPLSLTFLASSILVSLIPLLAVNTNFITNSSDSILKLNLYLSLYLFLLPTLAIGLIQPIILKKFIEDFSKIGSKYGILSFAWSTGSILGVFLTGFFFISNIGSKETIWLMSALLFIVGAVFAAKDKKVRLFFIITAIVIPVFVYIAAQNKPNPNVVIFQKETNYYDARVIDVVLSTYGKSRILALDFDFHSIQAEKETQQYTEMYPVFSNLKKDINKILVIGAGAYTLPKYFKNYYKDASVSVIEMDPEMINIGNDFFDLKKYDIKTIVGDAKVVINKNQEKYDVIFGDAYNSFISVPWYLLTKEWNDKIKERLNENGIYAINFIGSVSGLKSEFANSVLNTFKISFPNYYIFAFGKNPEDVQNIVFLGIKGDRPINDEEFYKKLLASKSNWLADKLIPVKSFSNLSTVILTDNFSPVEKLMEPTIKNYFSADLMVLKRILAL